MTYLLDTNILSEIMRKAPDPKVLAWFLTLETVTISAITEEELVFGLRHRGLYHKEAWLRQLLAAQGQTLPVTSTAAHWSGEKRAQLQLDGRTVPMADALIAACAWEHNLILATRNTKDFQGFGLALFNPFE